MKRPSPCRAFTLVEMLVVMAVIAILTGIILSLNGLVQKTGARHRAQAEIRAMSGACEAYKADNGGYPQIAASTDALDPVKNCDPGGTIDPPGAALYKASSLYLWQQLTGHNDPTNPTVDPTKPSAGTNYAADIFKDTMLGGTKNGATNRITAVTYIQDPFGNSYGYSTAGLAAEQAYRASLITSGTSATRTAAGYNPTFDLWSTAGNTTAPSPAGTTTDVHNKWVKNW